MPFPNFPHPSLATLNLSHPIFSTVVTGHNLFSWVWLFASLGFHVIHYLPDIKLMSIELMMPSNRLIFLLPPFPGCSWESCSLMHRAWNMSIVSGSQELSRRLVSELVRDSDGDWEPGAWAGCRRWNEMPVVPSPAACPGLGPSRVACRWWERRPRPGLSSWAWHLADILSHARSLPWLLPVRHNTVTTGRTLDCSLCRPWQILRGFEIFKRDWLSTINTALLISQHSERQFSFEQNFTWIVKSVI